MDLVARERGWNVVPALDLAATPSATVADDVLEHFWATLRATVERARPLDAVFLSLHGAMACRSFPDADTLTLAIATTGAGAL